jgi:SAM-dependent MidA family methyltransferase
VRVEAFLRAALHDPDDGYYARRLRGIGRRGDFSTSATIGPWLGRAIASWARRRGRGLGGIDRHLIEIGGGTGELAEAILRALGPFERLRTTYHLVEGSAPLEREQRRRLRGRRVRWHADARAALAAASGRALVFSNELVDSFPCLLVERRGALWHEVHVDFEGERPVERLEPLDEPRLLRWPASVLARGERFPEGQRCEIHLAYAEWLAELAPALRRGRLLTIDYGETVERLYDRRPHGSLRGYFHHQLVLGRERFMRRGRQDLTADVNFTDLAAWGARSGLATAALSTQREFLLEFLPGAVRLAAREPALAYLLAEEGPGGAFKVWEGRTADL